MIKIGYIKERSENSNKETIVIDKEVFNLKDYLAEKKILIAVSKNPLGKQLGFFKLNKKELQLHVCIPKEKDKSEWHRFLILDANEEEAERNKRLNIFEGEKDD